MKKYKILEKEKNGLRRIQALYDFFDVKKGDLGGFVESEENLSHEGDCWVYDNAEVFGNAKVYGNAQVFGNAKIYGNALVSGKALVFGNAEVFGNARVESNAEVFRDAQVFGDARVFGYACVFGNARVFGKALVFGNAQVFGNVKLYGNAFVFENAQVFGDARVFENAWVFGNARIYGKASVFGNTKVFGDAKIYGDAHLKFGEIDFPLKTFKEEKYIFSSLGVLPENGKYTLYKWVDKIFEGKYASLHDPNFIYEDGKIAEEKNYDPNIMKSCSSGLHVFISGYFKIGDTLIQVEVKVEDIITCQEGKLRVKRLRVIGKVNNKKTLKRS